MASELEVYDKAEWHVSGDWPAGLPEAQANVHTGLYLGWLVERGRTSAAFRADFPELVEAFRARAKTGPEIYDLAGGVLASDMLDDVGNAFTHAYYDLEHGAYLSEYVALLAADLPSAYHVADTWANYEKLRAHLDAKLEEWQRSGGGAPRRSR